MDGFKSYDYEKVFRLQEKQGKKYMDIARRFVKAKESGNEKQKQQAVKALAKHREENRKYKKMAEDAGLPWYL